MSEIINCKACSGPFRWDDDVIKVKDEYYHEKCITLYPTGFVAYLDDEFLGETENDNGDMACSLLDEGRYVDDEESEAE